MSENQKTLSPIQKQILQNKMDNFTTSLTFLSITLLAIYENLPFVLLNVISNNMIRQLLIEYETIIKVKLLTYLDSYFYLKIL